MNLRPPAPKEDWGGGQRVALAGTASQPLDIPRIRHPANPLIPAGDNACDAGLVPALSPHRDLPERLLNVTEVATRLGICAATVYTLCGRGEIAHVRVSNAIRVAPGDVDRFIAQRRRSGPTSRHGGQS